MLTYGTLLNMVNFNDRWTYKGSVTTPPCGRFVHWNVLRTVYPISQKHLDLFKKQLGRNYEQTPSLVQTGNWRAPQVIDMHAVTAVNGDALTGKQDVSKSSKSGELFMLEGNGSKDWLTEEEYITYAKEQKKTN